MTAIATEATTLLVDDLTVRYGDMTAVDAVSLSGRPGEILGLLGPNGAGKTSVIRALTTIVPIAGGSAVIAGHPHTEPAAIRACIGVLPESNGYPGAQNASAYLRYYGRLFGLSRDEATSRADRLLGQMGLGDNHNRISTYSRGMRQRLGLVRSLMNDPAIVFLDEPTLGLDPAGKEDILAQLTQTAVNNGTCVVLCTHLLDEVERVCDRVAIMNRARIVADGTVDEVIATAAVGGTARVRVSPADLADADRAMRDVPAVLDTSFDNTRPGDIDVDLAPTPDATTSLLRALLDARIAPRAFDLHGARLSDAFLALTAQTNGADR